MNGVHDLGGMHGFGPVEREPGPPALESWEAAVIAIMNGTMSAGLYNIDEFRHAIERMEPVHYLASPYFEHWLDGIARLLDEKGLVSRDEVEARAAGDATSVGGTLERAPPDPLRGTVRRDIAAAPRFSPGDAVSTRVFAPAGHTRLARYARGKRGTVHLHRGAYVFPDANAHGLGEQPGHVYSVRFAASELWGESAEPRTAVFIDLWEPYLLPA